MDIEHLVFENGPKRVGPFSHAVKAGEFIFITGQMPTLPENPDVLVSIGVTGLAVGASVEIDLVAKV